MTQHDIAARAPTYVIALICVVAAGAIAADLDKRRDAENLAQAQRTVKQAKDAAQPDAWARLERQGCAMVACDRIRK